MSSDVTFCISGWTRLIRTSSEGNINQRISLKAKIEKQGIMEEIIDVVATSGFEPLTLAL